MAEPDSQHPKHSTRLTALEVYESVRYDGEQELARPTGSLWWSGVAAGIAISSSVVAKALIAKSLPDSPWAPALADFGYCVGFILVVLGRMQLFTENTITVVLPLMARPNWGCARSTLRLWVVVFIANMVGTFAAAIFTSVIGFATDSQLAAMLTVASPLLQLGWTVAMLHAIPAGFFVAVMVWMLPNSRGFEMWVIVICTYMIAIGGFAHVVVGSMEVWLLVLADQMSVFQGVWGFILPAFIGNVLGGTVLFSLLAYGQVRREIDENNP